MSHTLERFLIAAWGISFLCVAAGLIMALSEADRMAQVLFGAGLVGVVIAGVPLLNTWVRG